MNRLACALTVIAVCFQLGCGDLKTDHCTDSTRCNQASTTSGTSGECRLTLDHTLKKKHLKRLSHFKSGAYCTHSSTLPFFRAVNFKVEDIEYAKKRHRVFINPKLRDLRIGKAYNYTLTTDGEITFGIVIDFWETGVKHMHLAQGRDVLAAGEFFLEEDYSYKHNLMSGTFMLPISISHPEYMRQLEEDIQSFFSDEFGSNGTFENSGTLLPLHLQPTQEEKNGICAFGDFAARNPQACNLNNC